MVCNRCGLLDGGWILTVCRVLLAALLLVGVHLMLLRRSRYVQHREWLVSGEAKRFLLETSKTLGSVRSELEKQLSAASDLSLTLAVSAAGARLLCAIIAAMTLAPQMQAHSLTAKLRALATPTVAVLPFAAQVCRTTHPTFAVYFCLQQLGAGCC